MNVELGSCILKEAAEGNISDHSRGDWSLVSLQPKPFYDSMKERNKLVKEKQIITL